MIYLYAYTNHRADLDSLRRMGALWEMLKEAGIDAELLVNDYRAQLAGRELGLPLATTIETVVDIDAVAEFGDTVVIDSPEDAGERMERYVERFERVIRVLPCGEAGRYGETVVDPLSQEGWLIASRYTEATQSPKKGRFLIFRDADPAKELLEHRESFDGLGLELYWGSYYYVKYEDLLAEHFTAIRESEEYAELVSEAETVVTAMPQTALEARTAGARVLYLDWGETPDCFVGLLRGLEIPVVPLGDRAALEAALATARPGASLSTGRFWQDFVAEMRAINRS
jgi:hypothetical protein